MIGDIEQDLRRKKPILKKANDRGSRVIASVAQMKKKKAVRTGITGVVARCQAFLENPPRVKAD